ncbi:MAG: 3-deoxy-D-manno-octulosonic acid transferase, partial [Bacteroidales bacterium]|nr:3-deoxy-D-manno-octulosonic acid transferase [Bacteroidales bacterium]
RQHQVNARRFIKLVKTPKKSYFVKYDIWPNYIKQLRNKRIPRYLFSAHFRPNQIYFKRYGGWFRKHLWLFNRILCKPPPLKSYWRNTIYRA